MGRNAIPKLGEWRDGYLYKFSAHGGSPLKTILPPQPDDGRMIVYERISHSHETLAACYADGFQECMASMWQSGFYKGEKAGYEKAKKEMRAALGLSE